MMIKVNNSCTVCAIQFLHFKSCQHGLAEGSCSQGDLLSQLLLFCQICDWTLNYCFLVTRDLQREVMCYRCFVGMPRFKMYGPSPERCWNLLATLAAGPRPLRTGCFASTQHIPARNVCVKVSQALCVCHSGILNISCAGLRFWWSHGHTQTSGCVHQCPNPQSGRKQQSVWEQGHKGWLSEQKECWNPRKCLFSLKKIKKYLIESEVWRVFPLNPVDV